MEGIDERNNDFFVSSSSLPKVYDWCEIPSVDVWLVGALVESTFDRISSERSDPLTSTVLLYDRSSLRMDKRYCDGTVRVSAEFDALREDDVDVMIECESGKRDGVLIELEAVLEAVGGAVVVAASLLDTSADSWCRCRSKVAVASIAPFSVEVWVSANTDDCFV